MYPIHKYNLCRLCLFVGDQLMNIFEENDTIDFIAEEAIEDLLQFKVVKEAGFPWLVCASCLGKLTEFRLFKRRCIECKVTFEERYQNAEESVAVEIRPEEMEIKEETVDEEGVGDEEADDVEANVECLDRVVRRVGAEVEEEVEEELRGRSRLESEASGDFVKADAVDSGGGVRALGSSEDISAGDMVEVKVEEVHIGDDHCFTRINADAIGRGKSGTSPCRRNRLTVCDGSVDFGGRDNVSVVEGGREEFMCAVCEEVFLDLESLRNHMPCHSRIGRVGDVSESILSDCGDGNVDWDHGGGNFVSVRLKKEMLGPPTRKETSMVELGEVSIGLLGSAFGKTSGNAPGNTSGSNKGVVGRKIVRVARPRYQKNFTVMEGRGTIGRGVVPGSSVGDKTVSYQCDMCHHGFSKLEKLKKHIQSHSEEGGYACPTCGKSFRTRWSLKNHKKSHHKVTLYECPVCGRKFSRPQHLEAHRATHGTGTEYQCGICRKTFPQSSYLDMHLRSHDGTGEATQCHICGKRFSQKGVLSVHLRVHMGIKPYECHVCKKRFSQKNTLKNHLLTHEGVMPYSCEVCQKGFREKSELSQHMRNQHSGTRPYACHLCGKTYIQQKSLRTHLENHTTSIEIGRDLELPSHSRNEVGLPLRECPNDSNLGPVPVSIAKATSNPVLKEILSGGDQLRAQTLRPDFGLNPGILGAQVTSGMREENLCSPHGGDDPVRTNLGTEPQDEDAAVVSEIVPHEGVGMDHLESASKLRPYKCHICHECFVRKEDLNSHNRVHVSSTPHNCSVCGKYFNDTVSHRKHMLLHTESKPYDCPFCAKTFTLRKNLKRHLELDSCLKRLDLNASDCVGSVGDAAQGILSDPGNSWGKQNEGTVLVSVPDGSGGQEHGFGTPSSDGSMNKTLDDIMAAAKEASVEVYLEQEGSVSRVFPCTFCEKTFLRTDQLKKHLMVHGGIKPHACTMCSRRFTEKGNLSKHMKTHAYEKPYPCEYCEKAYTQKKNLERHMMSHQGEQQ